MSAPLPSASASAESNDPLLLDETSSAEDVVLGRAPEGGGTREYTVDLLGLSGKQSSTSAASSSSGPSNPGSNIDLLGGSDTDWSTSTKTTDQSSPFSSGNSP